MRFVIYGVGAIGGVLAAKLTLGGANVEGIARGAQLEALRSKGLTLRTPAGDEHVRFKVAPDLAGLGITADDVIVLAMKSQDTMGALYALRAAGITDQPIVCAQNGVANERIALRFFPNIYGMMMVMPATYVTPGEVVAFGMPKAGFFDLGRYPSGNDATVAAICAALDGAGFAAFASDRVMDSKYAKLILNLGNVLDAAVGEQKGLMELAAPVLAEGRAVLTAAGIAFSDVGPDTERRKQFTQMRPVPGAERIGSSSAQSLARGAGSIETDYLNGEIVLLGRLHGVPTPLNAKLVALGAWLVAERRPPGSLSLAEVEAALRSP